MEEKRIIVEMGDGTRRGIPESKWPEAQAAANYLKELALKAGWPRKRAEQAYSIRIVNDDE